jgi:hypothetical protein
MVPGTTTSTKGDTMSHLIATAPVRARIYRDQVETAHAVRDPEGKQSRLWTLIEALAYAGAYVDPSGILAVERLRQAKEEQERRDAR